MEFKTEKTIGILLISGSVLLLIPYSLLISNFNYPDILRQNTGTILVQFHEKGNTLVYTWLAFALVGLPLLEAVVLIGDKFSQNIIISQVETMHNYSNRFYQQQFLTRTVSNHKILDNVEKLIDEYFINETNIGLPTVQYVADALHISPTCLSGLLKSITGQTTQQDFHEKLIEKAKERLSTTMLSVSEIAFELGFEHSQSFSKLFKAKTKQTPKLFREQFQ